MIWKSVTALVYLSIVLSGVVAAPTGLAARGGWEIAPPIKLEPVKVEPPKHEPVKVEAPKHEPPKVEPPKHEPPKHEPPKVEPPKHEPPKVEPPKHEPPKHEPPKVEPPKHEPPKVKEPPKPEPPKHEPPKHEPPKHEPVKVEEPPKHEPIKVEPPKHEDPWKVKEPPKHEPLPLHEPIKLTPVHEPTPVHVPPPNETPSHVPPPHIPPPHETLSPTLSPALPSPHLPSPDPHVPLPPVPTPHVPAPHVPAPHVPDVPSSHAPTAPTPLPHVSRPYITLIPAPPQVTPTHFDNWGGFKSISKFDDFHGVKNFDGHAFKQEIVQDEEQSCRPQEVNVVQQRLLVLQEMAKRIITEHLCDVEVQTIAFEQYFGSLENFGRDLRRIPGGHQVGFDRHIAGHFSKIVDKNGDLTSDKWKFTGHDLGKETVQIKGHNWDDTHSPQSVEKAWKASRGAWARGARVEDFFPAP